MKICVYCASSDKVADKYFEVAEILGRQMAREKHVLVYGVAGGTGGEGSWRGRVEEWKSGGVVS